MNTVLLSVCILAIAGFQGSICGTPGRIDSVVIESSNTSCFSHSQLRSARNTLIEKAQEFLSREESWIEVVNLDMTNSSHHCPSPWSQLSYPRRCDAPCCSHSVTFSVPKKPYSQVLGRVIGSGFGSLDGFNLISRDIDGVYVDGVSITHGSSPRKHIWSLGAGYYHGGFYRHCPCESPQYHAPPPPSFVGNNYFCDGPYNGLLWDGLGCVSNCCKFNNPPWFNVTLPASTSDDIEDHNLNDWGDNFPSTIPPHTASVAGSLTNGQKPNVQDNHNSGVDLHHKPDVKQQELETTVASLSAELEKLGKEKLGLLNKLEALHENSSTDIDRARREISSKYEHQIASSQAALLETEHRLQEVEREAEESKRAYKLLEDRHAQDILDRDQKHAMNIVNMEQKLTAEVARVKEETRGQPIVRDADEEAAEWMKVIKDKMREMHEEEKQELVKKHLDEMKACKEDMENKMALQQQKLQAAANEQIQAFYQQCLKSYQTLEEEHKKVKAELDQKKTEVERQEMKLEQQNRELQQKAVDLDQQRSAVQCQEMQLEQQNRELQQKLVELKEKNAELDQRREENQRLANSCVKQEEICKDQALALSSLEAKYSELAKEKEVVEQEYSALLQLSEGRQTGKEGGSSDDTTLDSASIEKSFKAWNEAASKLEEKLSSPEKPDKLIGDSQSHNKEIVALKALVEDYEAQKHDTEAKHHRELALVKDEYENQLREMKESHHQEMLQLKHDSEERLKEALLEAQRENTSEMEKLSVRYKAEIEKLRTASAMVEEQNLSKLSQLEEELFSAQQARAMENTALEKCKEEIRNLRMSCEDYEAQLEELQSEHDKKLSQVQADADKLMKERVSGIHQQNDCQSKEMIARYESEIQRLREANSAALNESMGASLEVAEEHMKGLREQLNSYRNKEQSFESHLAEMEKEHRETMEALRKRCEEEKKAAISLLEKEKASSITKLEDEISFLKREKELIETKVSNELKASHLREINEIQSTMKAEMKKAVDTVQHELEDSHHRELQTLRQSMSKEFDDQKVKLEAEIQNEASKERALVVGQKDACIEDLKATHALEVRKLSDTISQAEVVISKRFEGEIAGLKGKIKNLESDNDQLEKSRRQQASEIADLQHQVKEVEKALSRVEIERNQISEDCDRYQKRATALEVEASIAKSSEENLQKELEENKVALRVKEEEMNALQFSIENFRCRIAELEREATDLMAEKDQIAKDLQAKQEECMNLENKFGENLVVKEQELAAVKLEITQCLGDLAKSDTELQASHDRVKVLSEDLLKKENDLDSRNSEYQVFIDQLAAKNQAFVELQVENDSLKTSFDSLKKKHQEEVEASEILKRQLQGRWGESEEIELLKKQVTELVSFKELSGSLAQKIETLMADITDKEKALSERSLEVSQTSERCKYYEEESANYAKEVANLKQNLSVLERSKVDLTHQIELLEATLSERSRSMKDMERVIGELEKKMEQSEVVSKSAIEEAHEEANRAKDELKDSISKLKVSQSNEQMMLAELQEKEEAIRDLTQKCNASIQAMETQSLKLERQAHELHALSSQLEGASRAEDNLRSQLSEKEHMISRLNGLINSDKQSSTSLKEMTGELQALQGTVNSMEQDLADKERVIEELNQTIEELQDKLSLAEEELSKLVKEKSQMQQDIAQYQRESQETGADSKWPEKCSELEQIVSNLDKDKERLEAQLSELQVRTTKMDALEARVRDQEKIIASLRAKNAPVDNLSTHPLQTGQDLLKNPLGATLTRARKTLAERLHEKDTIEKELRFRRAKLERQLAEKQCLEHLLFEKKRFELELQNQKSLLKKELEELERKNSFGEPIATN